MARILGTISSTSTTSGRTLGKLNLPEPKQNLADSIWSGLSKGKILPITGMLGGGLLGGIVGSFPGAVAGAGLGGGLGEATAEKLRGEELQSKEILQTGVEAAGAEAIGAGAIRGLGYLTKPIISKGKQLLEIAGKRIQPLTDVIKAGLQGVKKVLPGISEDSAKVILSKADRVEALATQKTLPINYIIDDVQKAANKFEQELGKNYEQQWQKLLVEGNKYSYNRADSIRSINNFLEAESKKGNVFFKLGKTGKLDFSASPFTKSQQQNVIKAMVDEINTSQPQNIAEIRALKQRLNAIYQEYSAQFGQNPQLNRVVTNMVNAVDEALPKELRAISKEYSEGLNFLNQVDELLLPTSKVTGELKGSTVSRIKSLGKEEIKELYGDFLDDFKKRTGYNLEEELDIYNAAKEINPNLIPQDIGGIGRGIQKALNPLIGMLKIKQAQGLLPGGEDIIEEISTKYEGFEPVLNFLQDKAIPAAIKVEIFNTLQELFRTGENR